MARTGLGTAHCQSCLTWLDLSASELLSASSFRPDPPRGRKEHCPTRWRGTLQCRDVSDQRRRLLLLDHWRWRRRGATAATTLHKMFFHVTSIMPTCFYVLVIKFKCAIKNKISIQKVAKFELNFKKVQLWQVRLVSQFSLVKHLLKVFWGIFSKFFRNSFIMIEAILR